ncbi:hypothetical protein BV20DRAFT_1055281 [Pilatotrama ljubarskyi]|nr:hypothetical protein BV20DRAFT_1055281 [Pilatotrama ljubarskyi]
MSLVDSFRRSFVQRQPVRGAAAEAPRGGHTGEQPPTPGPSPSTPTSPRSNGAATGPLFLQSSPAPDNLSLSFNDADATSPSAGRRRRRPDDFDEGTSNVNTSLEFTPQTQKKLKRYARDACLKHGIEG